jgi:hypothetical protein
MDDMNITHVLNIVRNGRQPTEEAVKERTKPNGEDEVPQSMDGVVRQTVKEEKGKARCGNAAADEREGGDETEEEGRDGGEAAQAFYIENVRISGEEA